MSGFSRDPELWLARMQDGIDDLTLARLILSELVHYASGRSQQDSDIAKVLALITAVRLSSLANSDWLPIASAPRDGSFIVKNALGEVCPCQSRDGQRIVQNMPGYSDWSFPQAATHWQPLPKP